MTTPGVTKNHRIHGGWLAVALSIAAWAPASLAANTGNEIADTFRNGTFHVNFRYRYEFVDQDNNGKKDANASTLRTRFVYKTAQWNDLDITINMDDVHTIVGSDYNSTRNGKTQYQAVPDPKGTSLNIAALTYSGIQNTQVVLGRQRIIRGNARFVGNVGWRQNEQTYDALSVNYAAKTFKAFYSYISRVNRIFGPDSGTPTEFFSSESHLLNASYKLNDAFSALAYGYLLDFNNAASASSRTFGIRLTGAPKIGDGMALTYTAEFASQEDYKNNPVQYDADYLLAELGISWEKYSIKAGYELLEGNGMAGHSFQTPVATLHAMNGWADKFLSTPANGLQDRFIAATAKVSKGSLRLILHDFSADTGSTDYGREIDFIVKWPLSKHYSILGKLALYDADNGVGNPSAGSLGQDTTKVWLQLTAAF